MRRRIDKSIAGRLRLAGGVTLGLIVCLVGGCKTSQPETKVVVPGAATQAPEYEGDGSVPEQRYVIRMSDGSRDWEVEFPEVATGYEMHIPLDEANSGGPLDSVEWDSENLTEADKELLEELRRERGEMEREGVYVDGENVNDPTGGEGNESAGPEAAANGDGAAANGDGAAADEAKSGSASNGQDDPSNEADPAPYRPSYLLGIEEVRKLFEAGRHELAMVRIKKLEKAYPDDEKILSMKGTLWMKLGRESLARKAWERVLQINPDNEQVKAALKRLNESE